MNAIFIGGCPRSGTTMLGSILGGGENCFATPESQFKEILVHDHLSMSETEDRINQHFKLKLWKVFNVSLKGITQKTQILPLILEMYKKVHEVAPHKNIWIDHSPDNFELIPTLSQLFPEAKFVHIIRDSRGVSASILPLDWGPNDALSASEWWLQKTAYGFSAEICYPKNVFHVRYEDILLHPEETIKNLCDKVGLTFHPNMLLGDDSFLPTYTKHQHVLVGSSPNTAPIDQWKQKLSKDEIEILEKRTGTILTGFGYQVTNVGKLKLGFFKKRMIVLKRLRKRFVGKLKFSLRQKKALKQVS